MQGVYTILLLILSNVFMTFAWYGHLKLQQTGVSTHWPLIAVILFSWGIALLEYTCQVPANRLGIIDNGGPFSLIQLKVVQEVISLIVFKHCHRPFRNNHIFHAASAASSLALQPSLSSVVLSTV